MVYRDGSKGIDGLGGCRGVAISPDGRCLYVAGYADSAIASFRREEETGALRFEGAYSEKTTGPIGLEGVHPLLISPDGTYLFAGGYTDGTLVLFSREPSTGALTFLEGLSCADAGLEALAGIRSVALSPDGANLYAAGYTDGTIASFTFDSGAARLQLLQSLRDGDAGLDFLAGAACVQVSPDGTQVALACLEDDSLLLFDRDPITGALALKQQLVDGSAGCEGLNGASCVLFSPDGRYVYVTGYYDNAVSVLSRDPQSGMLTPIQLFTDASIGADALYHAQELALSPDGASLYVTASAADCVAIFDRDPASGTLDYSRCIGGMDGARGLTVSRDGRNCYVATAGASALYLLNRRP